MQALAERLSLHVCNPARLPLSSSDVSDAHPNTRRQAQARARACQVMARKRNGVQLLAIALALRALLVQAWGGHRLLSRSRS